MSFPLSIVSLAVLAGLSLNSVSAQSFDRQDETYITPSELQQRNDGNNPRGPLTASSEVVVNEYKHDASLPPLSAYVSNWGQYGRKFNVETVAKGYDKLVLSFFGICGTKVGDPSVTSSVESLARHCGYVNAPDYELMTTDSWGDMASLGGGAQTQQDQSNAGNPHWEPENVLVNRWYQGQDSAAGMFGAMKEIKEKYPEKTIAISILGWSLSSTASDMVSTAANRTIFIDSVIQFLGNFPMVEQIDIDWEYPGGGGAEHNNFSEEDGANYALLISELRAALNSANLTNTKIAIAAGAPTSKLDASNLKELVDKGVDIIHLMTYDFFGTPWAEELNHHTNLYNGAQEWSSDKAIKHMINNLGVPASAIHLGYAAYSRNARHAQVDSISPLSGSYSMPSDGNLVGGSWEAGVYEWYDFEQYFATINEEDGLKLDKVPGYQLLTDKEANADYVYSRDKQFFMSLDTPRTVYLKAQYVKEMGLGGLFTWMADYDNGYLMNAAREGLGYEQTANSSNIDMENIIFTCGENITSQQECIELTTLDNDTNLVTQANAGADVVASFELDTNYALDGSASTSSDGELTYLWKKGKVTGIDKSLIKLKNKNTPSAHFVIPDAADVANQVTATFKLTVTDEAGNESTDSVVYTLVSQENAAPIAIANNVKDLTHGETFTLNAKKSSDPDGDALSYQWVQTKGEQVALEDNGAVKKLIVPTDGLKNIEQELAFELTVSDGVLDSTDSVEFTVYPDISADEAPNAQIYITGDKTVGSTVTLDGSISTDDGGITSYRWEVVSPAGSSATVDGEDAAIATFVPEMQGEYTVSLSVVDTLGSTDSASTEIQIEEAAEGGCPIWDISTTYAEPGNVVQWNDAHWKNDWWTQGEEPGTTGEWGVWKEVSSPDCN